MIGNDCDTISGYEIRECLSDLEDEDGNGPTLADDDHEEYDSLKKFYEEIKENSEDGEDAQLIRESYFSEYAQEYANDIGENPSGWPYSHIDWDNAAEELMQDFQSADWDGVTYYFR